MMLVHGKTCIIDFAHRYEYLMYTLLCLGDSVLFQHLEHVLGLHGEICVYIVKLFIQMPLV